MIKKVFIVGLIGLAFGCKSNEGLKTGMVTRAQEPTYIQDRMVEDYSSSRTNSQGATGPGVGTASGANFYRKEALKALNDTTSMEDNRESVRPALRQADEINRSLTDSIEYEEVPW